MPITARHIIGPTLALALTAPAAEAFDFSETSVNAARFSSGTRSNDSIQTGKGIGTANDIRSFFIFDIPEFSDPVATVQVAFEQRGSSTNGINLNRTLSLRHYTGNIADLENSAANVDVYDALGTGPVIGTTTVFIPDSDNAIATPAFTIQLNLTARQAINDIGLTGGGQFAFGAELDLSNPELTDGERIWSRGGGDGAATLQWTLVPEINGSGFAYIAFILGALGLWLYSGAGAARDPEAA